MGLTSYQKVGSVISEIECLNGQEKLNLIERLAQKNIELIFKKNDSELKYEEEKFEVGKYYTFEDTIFKIIALGAYTHMALSYRIITDFLNDCYIIYRDSMMADEAREATDEEIKLFKNAVMNHESKK